MLTRREAIKQLLEEDFFSLQEIAFHYRAPLKEIIDDFNFIENDIKGSGQTLFMKPAQCKSCGYQYRDRRKVETPSKCPDCHKEQIEPAKFKIE